MKGSTYTEDYGFVSDNHTRQTTDTMLKYIILAIFCIHTFCGTAQSRKERKQLFNSNTNYEIQMLGVGQDGTKVFKIWAFGKKPDEAIMQAKLLAIRACLLEDYPVVPKRMRHRLSVKPEPKQRMPTFSNPSLPLEAIT